MAELKASKSKLEKNVHFLAVSDEENDMSGSVGSVRQIVEEGNLEALQGADALVNEGGYAPTGVLGSSTALHVIGTEEKGGAWLKFTSTDANALLLAMNRLQLYPVEQPGMVGRLIGRKPVGAAYGCKLTNAVTPQAKVNVVPSKLELKLTCKQGTPTESLAKLFATEDKSIQSAVKLEGNATYSVSLQTASASHGSLSLRSSVLDGFALGMQRLGLLIPEKVSQPDFYRYEKTEATNQLINTIGENHQFGKILGWRVIPQFPSLGKYVSVISYIEQKVLKYLGSQLSTERLFRTSCAWTSFQTKEEGVETTVDCRLLRPRTAAAFLSQVKQLLGELRVKVRPESTWDYTASAATHPMVKAIQTEVESQSSGKFKRVASAFLFPAGSDMTYTRNPGSIGSKAKPIPSFGFFPAEMDASMIGTIHGSDERFPVKEAAPATLRYARVIEKYATSR